MGPLKPQLLATRCQGKSLPFKTTEEVAPGDITLGQARAKAALELGIAMPQSGFHIYAMGPNELQKRRLIADVLQQTAVSDPPPPEICYVYNFDCPNQPKAMTLSPSWGVRLKKDMKKFIRELSVNIPTLLRSSECRTVIKKIKIHFSQEKRRHRLALKQFITESGFVLKTTVDGFDLQPVGIVGESELHQIHLNAEQKKKQLQCHRAITRYLSMLSNWKNNVILQTNAFQTQWVKLIIKKKIAVFRRRYRRFSNVIDYLQDVEIDIAAHYHLFLDDIDNDKNDISADIKRRDVSLLRYSVNVITQHTKKEDAPVVWEEHPTVRSLFGHLPVDWYKGTKISHFMLISAGALHRANGGYLIINAQHLLDEPTLWNRLKYALTHAQLHIPVPVDEHGSAIHTEICPEPCPLRVKVILLGDRELYYSLFDNDHTFKYLFRIVADFTNLMKRLDENLMPYVAWVVQLIHLHDLLPFSSDAMAVVLDYSARIARDAQKYSLDAEQIGSVLCEASLLAIDLDLEAVTAAQVYGAIKNHDYRMERIFESYLEDMQRGFIVIDTTHKVTGQANGLTVVEIGDYAFGHPVRITASASIGKGDIIDIERETELSGATHTKGVLILSGFLHGRYAKQKALSLMASLVFEQNYDLIEGDSASLAELCALLSALSELPLSQRFAMTGAVDQFGHVQLVGGINEKIEGFFALCEVRGLKGKHGVIIPKANMPMLMLQDKVIDAVKKKKFVIYAVDHVDQAMTLLTGFPAGKQDKRGNFERDTINFYVQLRLLEFARRSQ